MSKAAEEKIHPNQTAAGQLPRLTQAGSLPHGSHVTMCQNSTKKPKPTIEKYNFAKYRDGIKPLRLLML
tara:strand:- start:278 stop:484 length:207 start_codon:yes stop_codon:yes gene_type:complete